MEKYAAKDIRKTLHTNHIRDEAEGITLTPLMEKLTKCGALGTTTMDGRGPGVSTALDHGDALLRLLPT